MDKKAQEEWVYRPIMLVLLVLTLIFLLFSTIGCESLKKTFTGDTKVVVNSKDTSFITLLNYLRTPVNDQTISDIIISSSTKDDFTELKIVTQDTLGKYFNNNFEECCWILYIYNQEGSPIKKIDKCGFFQGLFLTNSRTSKIELTNGLKVSLIIGGNNDCISK